MSDALIIFGGLAVLLVVAAVFAWATSERSSEGDLEHFDHEPGDPSSK